MSTASARPDRLRAGALFLAFLLLYGTGGLLFQRAAPRAYRYLDELFDADVPSRIIDLTRFAGPHYRTHLHPLFLLLLNPLGVGLKSGLHGLGVDQAGRAAASLMCGVAGAAAVAAFFFLLRRGGLVAGAALRWSVLFGLSASQLFFSIFPETYAFSTLALVLVFALGGTSRPQAVAAGVAAFGMTLTNLGAVVLARARPAEPTAAKSSPGLVPRSLVSHVLAVLALAAGLSLLQAALYKDTGAFWQVDGLGRDDRLSFVWPRDARDVALRARELVAYFFLWDLAAPRLSVSNSDYPRTVVDCPPVSLGAFRPEGWAHGLLWSAVLVLALAAARRSAPGGGALAAVLGLWTFAQMGLHFVFGISLFLYTGQWTFAVVAVVALLLEPAADTPPRRRALEAALFLLVVLQAAANAAFLLEIARAFA